MIKRLLVPLDGSVLAEAVLPVAAQLTHMLQGTLILFRVYDVPPSDISLCVIEAEAEAAQTYLSKVALRPDLAGLQVETKTLGGAVALNILDAVQEYQADLLVMSSHGHSGFTRLALGSVAAHVARHASIPILVLRPAGNSLIRQWQGLGHPLRVLVALDGSSFAEAALLPAAQVIVALATPELAEVQLVRVVQPQSLIDEQDVARRAQVDRQLEQAVREAQNYLQAVTAQMHTHDLDERALRVTWSVAVAEDVAATLIQLAVGTVAPLVQRAVGEEDSQESSEAETVLIALASHGRGGIQRWILGSVAERVLEGTRVPLLIVRPHRTANLDGETTSSSAPGVRTA